MTKHLHLLANQEIQIVRTPPPPCKPGDPGCDHLNLLANQETQIVTPEPPCKPGDPNCPCKKGEHCPPPPCKEGEKDCTCKKGEKLSLQEKEKKIVLMVVTAEVAEAITTMTNTITTKRQTFTIITYGNDYPYSNNHATVILQPDYSHTNNYHDIRLEISFDFDTIINFAGKPENFVVAGLNINEGEQFNVCMKNENDGKTNCVTATLKDENKAVYVDIRVP